MAFVLPARLTRRPGPRSKRRWRRLRVPIVPGAAIFVAVDAPAGPRSKRRRRRLRMPIGPGAAFFAAAGASPGPAIQAAEAALAHSNWASGYYSRCSRRKHWARSKRRRCPLAAQFRRRRAPVFACAPCSAATAPAPGCLLRSSAARARPACPLATGPGAPDAAPPCPPTFAQRHFVGFPRQPFLGFSQQKIGCRLYALFSNHSLGFSYPRAPGRRQESPGAVAGWLKGGCRLVEGWLKGG